MRLFIFFIAVCISFSALAQQKEFEGVIKYNHRFRFDPSVADSTAILNELGESSVFYYKKGNYKWIYRVGAATVTVEYFDAKTQTVYLQYPSSGDTLFRSAKKGHNDSLLSFKTFNDSVKVICGLVCKKANTLTFRRGNHEDQDERTIYYSPEIFVPISRFSLYRTYAMNKVISKTKSWPLWIEVKASMMPVAQTFEAVEIVPQELSDDEVYLPKNKPVKQLSLF
ncbi:MAG: hypothetical protein QM764_11000 [Chitinophagaceae bacterium]